MNNKIKKFRRFKEDFYRWYFKSHCKSSMKYKELMPHHKNEVFGWFNGIEVSFKWGVYEDFFEKYGIYPQVQDCHGHEVFALDGVDRYHSTCCVRGGKYYAISFTNNKEEAREEAINKAVKLYEELEVLNCLPVQP